MSCVEIRAKFAPQFRHLTKAELGREVTEFAAAARSFGVRGMASEAERCRSISEVAREVLIEMYNTDKGVSE